MIYYFCPYLKDEKNGTLRCEIATIRPPDSQAKQDMAYLCCANPKGYKKCPFYIVMERYYERKYKR